MVERRTELDRRYRRKKKMKKLKAKLTAGGADREAVLAKIKRLSPWWTEAALNKPGTAAPAAKDEAPKEPKKKAPPKPKAEKKPAAPQG